MSERFAPPYSHETEAAFLSCLVQWPAEILPIVKEEQIEPEWFYILGAHFGAIVDYLRAGRAADFVAITTYLTDRSLLDTLTIPDAGQVNTGFAAASTLFRLVPSGAAFVQYLDTLREKFLARRAAEIAKHIYRVIAEEPTNAGLELVRQISASVGELASYGVRTDTIRQIKPHVKNALASVQDAYNSRGNTLGLSWGIASLDRITRGIRKRFGYYIAGRPAAGKSAFMGDIVDFIGTNPDQFAQATALVFSIEMTADQLVARSLMKRAYLPQQRIRDGLMSGERDFPKLAAAAQTLAEARIHVDDTATLTIDDIVARTRRFVRKHRAGETAEQRDRREKSERPDIVVAIDYLQRIKGVSKRAQQNRYLEVAEVTQGISAMLKELGVAGLICVQLGRAENEGPDKYPSLSDMRESGDIEAEAHVVIAMHRPVYYLPTAEKKQTYAEKKQLEVGDKSTLGARDLEHLAFACILKQREGPTENIPIHFEPSLAQFTAWNGEETTFSTATNRQQGHLADE
jgi:replicative DNA helicase